ncbi:Transcription factor RF2b, partial [Mucuna pruriens]
MTSEEWDTSGTTTQWKNSQLYCLRKTQRNLVNSESAARSNERMNRYTSELVGKVEKLRTKATNLSGEVTMLQRDTEDMAEKNKKIKMRLEAMRQESQRKEDLSQELKEELQHLREENLVLFLVNLLLASHSAMKRLTNSGQNRPNFRNFNRKNFLLNEGNIDFERLVAKTIDEFGGRNLLGN